MPDIPRNGLPVCVRVSVCVRVCVGACAAAGKREKDEEVM